MDTQGCPEQLSFTPRPTRTIKSRRGKIETQGGKPQRGESVSCDSTEARQKSMNHVMFGDCTPGCTNSAAFFSLSQEKRLAPISTSFTHRGCVKKKKKMFFSGSFSKVQDKKSFFSHCPPLFSRGCGKVRAPEAHSPNPTRTHTLAQGQ